MDIFESLKLRRMCRDYKSDPIPEEIVDRLIYAANRAPLGGNVSTRTLIVVRDRSTLRRMELISPGFSNSPPLAIAICTDETIAKPQDRSIATFDAGAAAENIALAAVSLGLGAAFVKSYPEPAMKRILHLPPHIATEIIVTVGYPADHQVPAPKAPPTPVFRESYGNLKYVNSKADLERDYFLELALYMLTSARTTVDEPSRYGPKRLMDSLQRLLAMPRYLKSVKEDKFLSEILSVLEQRTDMQISSVVYTDEFRRFLDDLINRFVDELEARQRTSRA